MSVDTMQDQYFDALKQAQGFVIDAVRGATDTIKPLVSALPSLPYADQLPAPDEAVKAGFDFVEKLVAAERQFTSELVSVLSRSGAETA